MASDLTERERMSNEQKLREALEKIKAYCPPGEMDIVAMAEAIKRVVNTTNEALASTEPEQPAAEGFECKHCQTKMLVTKPNPGDEYTIALCPNLLCPGLEPSTTEGEREKALYSTTLLRARDAKACCSKCSEAWTSAIAELERMSLALLAQPQEQPPIVPGKKWTPAALEEWTPEQWADALDAARSDLMCAEDFEPSDVAHVMDICAQVLRRPREQGDPNDCRDCGAPHWYNFMVPDDVWKKIAPDQPCLPEEGGMLCAQCIDKRCVALGIEAEGKFYFKGEAVVSRYPEEQGERIWIKPHELVDLRDDANGCAIIGSRAEDDGDDEGGDLLPATLIIHEPAGGEDE